jgi:CHAD domain-containing protein
MDVYLLNFEDYKNSLPLSMQEDLNPLYDFLLVKQRKVQQELARALRSVHYTSNLTEWEQYLNEAVEEQPAEANAILSIKQLSDLRIWKCFHTVLLQGNAITENSHGEQLHDLRKTCKKLRYLMEFFQQLYPDEQIKGLVKDLKGLQEVLGDFQDYEVQEQNLKIFSEEMRNEKVSTPTFLAMGVLIQNLDTRRCKARSEFAEKFAGFKREENQIIFRALFKANTLNKT